MSDDDFIPLPDADSIGEALGHFDRYLQFRQRDERIPGVQAAVYAAGSVRLSTAHGLADIESGVPLEPRHLFRIASHSKTFTATAVLQLVESGELRLDDTAGRWVDYLAGTEVGAVTVRELLSHASGLFRDSRDGDFWQLSRPFPDRATLRELLLDPAASVLGRNDRFKYSNIGYSLLGLIIEQVTGVSFAERVRSAIIDRLGLADLGPELDAARAADYATGYSSLAYADRRVPIEHIDTKAMASATGFYSTASDLVQYFAAHFFGDERLLTDSAKREMQHPWWSVRSGDRQYGLGLSVATVGERQLIGHGGGYPGHITNSVADTGAGLAISVLTNAIDGPAESLAHAGVKLLDLAGSKPRPTDGLDRTRYCGRFASLWGALDIAVLGGRLYRLHLPGADPVEDAAELEVVDGSTLRIQGGSGYGSYGELLSFTYSGDGSISSVRGESGSTLLPFEGFSLPDRVVVGG
ncbi:CubicO group peptidase (beta-lactamase class C family) [Nakamurella sp. UYEF19]|uniref:serine hydrolase domain-containing protein n=1 Tax=Nakamurella sp. UYEF19 TaxID=1756392 RepID=UPI0033920A14